MVQSDATVVIDSLLNLSVVVGVTVLIALLCVGSIKLPWLIASL